MKKFYFTFGSADCFPFKGGWVIVKAPDLKTAFAVFKLYYPHPKDKGILNCADYYTEDDFLKTEMYHSGNRGYYCHEIVGPHVQG